MIFLAIKLPFQVWYVVTFLLSGAPDVHRMTQDQMAAFQPKISYDNVFKTEDGCQAFISDPANLKKLLLERGATDGAPSSAQCIAYPM
jgi:hypothetical protein